jgi:hypothetical protein
MTNFEDNPMLNKLYEELAKRIEKYLKESVLQADLVDTEELVDSIRSGTVQVGDATISTSVVFSALLRLKDMKKLDYFTIPPLAPLIDWVERTGISKFAYIPGYPEGVKRPTESEQIFRVAKGIQYNLKARPNVRRGYRGIYNEDLYKKIIPEFIEALRASSEVWAKMSIEEALGFDTLVPTPSEELNAGRIQAAWNARDTKLARKYAEQE